MQANATLHDAMIRAPLTIARCRIPPLPGEAARLVVDLRHYLSTFRPGRMAAFDIPNIWGLDWIFATGDGDRAARLHGGARQPARRPSQRPASPTLRERVVALSSA